jgi:hypothetical protein
MMADKRRDLYVAPQQVRVKPAHDGLIRLHLEYLAEDAPWIDGGVRVVMRLTAQEARDLAAELLTQADIAEGA